MSYWYIAHEDELLLDLDDYMRPAKSGGPWGEIFFRRRLRNAMEDGKLDVEQVWLIESSTANHFHAFIKLRKSMPTLTRLVWQLHLGSDLYRGRADLMRYARGFQAPSLLIEQVQNEYREEDFFCNCTEKHVTSKQMSLPPSERCLVFNRLRGYTPWELFGQSHPDLLEKFIPLKSGRVSLAEILRCEVADEKRQCHKEKSSPDHVRKDGRQ